MSAISHLYADLNDDIARLRSISAELLAALEKITHEHLQFAGYFEHVDHEAQLEARAAIARAKP